MGFPQNIRFLEFRHSLKVRLAVRYAAEQSHQPLFVLLRCDILSDLLIKSACPELVEAASQTLKAQITATSPYRYRLEGVVHALLHIKTIECSIKNLEYESQEL